MTGSIDLVCEHSGRYYIADWKSNRCDGEFSEDRLCQEMAHKGYFLQYLIYAVALHQFLRGARPDYDYEKHFGGVFYVFLRGTQADSSRGIFTDRPSLKLIEDLSKILGQFVKL